jgi:hypothetical protein
MSDDFKADLISVNYAAGEQPTHVKLLASSEQLRVAIQRLGGAVGDVFTQQVNTGSSGTYDLASLATAGPNLNRVIGSTGWLNPGTFGRTLVTKAVTFTGHQTVGAGSPTFQGFTHYNRRQFKLPDPPIVFTSTEGAESVTFNYSYILGGAYWSLSGAEAPSGSRVTDLADLDSAGEYHVSPDGVITLFTPLDDGDTFTVTYQFNPLPDAYDGASLNVIPDFSQTGTLCTVAVVSASTYSVTLPTYTGRRSSPTLSSWTYPDEFFTYDNAAANNHPNLNQQLLLPSILRSNLSAGDIIPDGFIRLWDETNGAVIDGLQFTYQGTNLVYCTGATLTASTNRYRLVVSGTNLARTVYSLRENYRWHDHSGRLISGDGKYMGHRIHHYDLLNLVDEGNGDSDTSGFPVSELGPVRHPHPQYFHRYGWLYNDSVTDNDNLGNAFLGNLVLAGSGGVLGKTVDSYGLYLSDGPGSPNNTFSIIYSQASNQVKVFGETIDIDQNVIVDGSITCGSEITLDENPAAGASVTKESLYAKNVPKAWGVIGTTTTTPTLYDSFGIQSTVSYSGNSVAIALEHAMTGASFTVFTNCTSATVVSKATTSGGSLIYIAFYNWSGVLQNPNGAGYVVHFSVFGESA